MQDTTAPILEIAPGTEYTDPALRRRARATLEAGGVVLLARSGFELSEAERALIADAAVTLPTRRERESRNGRPTIFYDPERGRMLHARTPRAERRSLEAIMARYSAWADALMDTLFPCYHSKLARERLTYRPCDRSRPQTLHVDATYLYPTQGRAWLRVFTNINPAGRPRVWRIGETFEPFAARFVPTAQPPHARRSEALLTRLGIIKGRRTPYDLLMADLRMRVTEDRAYQRTAPQRELSFPAGATWIVLSDLVLHGASSGQHSMDQSYFLPPDALSDPACSSLRILERLTSHSLV
jgi:hypothetical protein